MFILSTSLLSNTKKQTTNQNKTINRPLAVSEDAQILNIWAASVVGEIASVVNL